MNLLFSIDDMYVDHFKVMLYSLVRQTKNRKLEIYVLQKTLLKRHTELIQYTQNLEVGYHPIIVGTEVFAQAPTTDRYPDTIYYRLLAHKFLPETLDRILYLDADMLCLNDFSSLYDMELGDQLYAAASHNTDGKFLDYVNKLRLKKCRARILLFQYRGTLDELACYTKSCSSTNYLRLHNAKPWSSNLTRSGYLKWLIR